MFHPCDTWIYQYSPAFGKLIEFTVAYCISLLVFRRTIFALVVFDNFHLFILIVRVLVCWKLITLTQKDEDFSLIISDVSYQLPITIFYIFISFLNILTTNTVHKNKNNSNNKPRKCHKK